MNSVTTTSKKGAGPGASKINFKRQEVGAAGGGGGQSRLQLGMFTIFPAFGIVLPNGHATITVDCAPETVGKCEEDLSIDITERDPNDQRGGIPYKLIAEACIPGINLTDIGAIFEEHRVCKSLNLWQQTTTADVHSVYGEEENRFLFHNVVVGRKAKARFKLINSQKVPCDLTLSLKPVAVKYSSKTVECFEIEPHAKVNIPAHSHTYATVLFTPTAMQHYTAIFEAAIEGVPASQAKARNLTFELAGDGNLPRVSIMRPVIRNKKGQPLLLFKKNLINRRETLPFIITNEGSLICKVYIDLIDPDGAFTLVPTGDSRAFIIDGYDKGGMKKPHTCSVLVNVGDQATFDVTYQPKEVGRTQATIQLMVEDNQYEDSIVQLVGEGYQDDVTLDNLHSIVQDRDVQYEDGSMADDDITAAKSNLIKFGDSSVGESKTLTLSMTNHSTTECIKFVWPEHPALRFSPTSGHIHAGLHKDMTVTFQAAEPMKLTEEAVQCNVTRITFDRDISEVPDWDDRMRTVKWTDAVGPNDRPAKRKVTEVEPEPSYSEVPESSRTVELLVTANSDYSKYKCKTDLIKFKDTLMFQTRVYQVQLQNKGTIRMDYNWQVIMDEFMQPSRSVTFAAETMAGSRCGSITPSIIGDAPLHMPFTVEPAFGSIPVGKKADIQVKFSPLDLNEYEAKLVCTIPNLEGGGQGPVIVLKGKSVLPYCHFELKDSDYLSSARRNPEMRGPRGAPPGTTLDSNTRVIEMESIGVGVKNAKKFSIVNPTTDDYNFQWVNDDDPDLKITPSFTCATPGGFVKSGKKQEVQFDFTPHNLGIAESFWIFKIPEQNISVPFLLVGDTKDPAVMFDRSHLNFKALLIGHEAMETVYMVNNETQAFHFNFEESSFFSAGYKDRLRVSPSSGYIPPQSRIAVNLFFTPQADYEVNFNIICGVKKKMDPLRLNVKAEGYCMNAMVVCEDSLGSKVELTSDGVNSINLGSVEINEESLRTITIFNSGKFNFDYKWQLTERSARGGKSVSIDPAAGAIGFEDSARCVLSFLPRNRLTLVGCELLLKIAHGPKYLINVTGTGVAPAIHFSFQQHNFGPCFVYRAGMPTHSVVLRATNRDKKDISLDCLYDSTQYLHHDFEAQVIPANHAVDITFSFYPREAKKYRETIEFEINGLSREKIEILGTGTEMKVEVTNPAQKNTRLGALRIGQVVKKQVQIGNNSPSPITFQLSCTPTTPELQDKSVLKIAPTHPITLPPKGGTCKVDVLFAPKSRIPQFAEEVMMECAGMFQPVFVLSGCCQGLEIDLDTHAIAFGSVVQKSQSSRKLVMSNTGDIGARFKWDAAKFLPDFSISPTSGYISPGMDVTFEVLFHPLDINSDIRYEKLRCVIEGASPLRLTLTGMCSGVPAFKEVQHFSSHVRNRETKGLSIINKTNQLWQLKPIIDGEYWSGADWFVVEPQQHKTYELTYYPLTMTHENRKHQGTIFFPLPDGNGLLYNLVGSATDPKPGAKVTRDVPCKTNAVELLPVTNWLKKPQRFKVKIEAIRPDKFDVGTTVKGLDYIDVPPNGKRDYKVNFYAHKEGITTCKVSFTNETTGEYQWLEVQFRATKGGPLDQIKLITPVRQSTQHSLVVKNPLTTHVTFTATCSVNEVALPSQVSVPAESESLLTLEFLPLIMRVQNGKLELNNADLGVYLYELECTATTAGPEKALYFKCPLGSHQTLPAKFLNFAKQKTEYTCKMENTTDFSSEKTVNAAPASAGGTETSVDLNFEPSRIGEIRSQLTISSPVGGEYVFPIFATCVPPKPQGPIIIKSGSTTHINFRNNFPNSTAFTFTVDNPAFHVAKGGDNIRGKKDHRIVVGYDGTDSGTKAPVMGKLLVSCARSAGGSTPAQWIYYLKGVTQDSK